MPQSTLHKLLAVFAVVLLGVTFFQFTKKGTPVGGIPEIDRVAAQKCADQFNSLARSNPSISLGANAVRLGHKTLAGAAPGLASEGGGCVVHVGDVDLDIVWEYASTDQSPVMIRTSRFKISELGPNVTAGWNATVGADGSLTLMDTPPPTMKWK